MAGYALSEAAQDVLAEGDVRIFRLRSATVEDGWVLVVFSVPHDERAQRYRITTARRRLPYADPAARHVDAVLGPSARRP